MLNFRWRLGNRWWALAAGSCLLVALALNVVRTVVKYQTPGPPDGINEGYCDFHNGIFFPSLALRNGISPYGEEYANDYPVARQIPFFSPSVLLVHLPLTYLPLRAAEVLYFLIMLACITGIAWVSIDAAGLQRRLDWLLGIMAGIVLSRAGHVTLFNGYFTFELVLAVIIALRFAPTSPWTAALALVIVSAKPTFILPLGFLMLARGNLRALVYGATLSILAALIPFAWLAWHEGNGDLAKGWDTIQQQIVVSQEVHRGEPNELPALSWTRIDAYAIYAKWTGGDPDDTSHLIVMAFIIAWPMIVLWHRHRRGIDDGVGGLTGLLIVSAMIVGLYRQSYDVLLLTPSLVAVCATIVPVWRAQPVLMRWWLAALMLLPGFNYFTTRMLLDRLDMSILMTNVLTSINALAMIALLVQALYLAGKTSR